MDNIFDSTRRELRPSDIVIPLSEVIEKLESRLSSTDLNAFLQAIVAGRRTEVRSGELITADFFNEVLARIAALDMRVAKLESGVVDGEAPVIESVSPKTLRVGDRLDVIGRNFPEGPPPNSVHLGGVPIERFMVASTTALAFAVPRIFKDLPDEFTLSIRKGEHIAQETVYVLPEVTVPEGKVTAQDITGSLGEIIVGDTYTLKFKVRSATTVPETYKLNLVFDELDGTATEDDWKQKSSRVFPDGKPVPPQITIAPETPVTVHAVITIPDGAVSGTVTLQPVSVNNPTGIVSTPASIRLEVGSTPSVNDPHTTFEFNKALAGARKAIIDGRDGVEIPYEGSGTLRVRARFTVSGHYTYSYRLIPDTGPWTNIVQTPSDSEETAPSAETIQLTLSLTAAAGPGHPEKRTLEIKAQHSNGETFESWMELPIQGYTAT